MTGISFIFGRGIFYFGKYIPGTWFDDNDKYEPKEKKGFGIKIDFPINDVIRPVGYFWKPAFWKKDKPTIQDYLNKGESFCLDFFGKKLFKKILTLGEYHWKRRTVWNPWYARHSFVFRLPKFLLGYLSIGTPWFNFYIGFRQFKVDPFTRDTTWCSSKDERRAKEEEPFDHFYSQAPSISIRNNRL